MRRPWVPWRRRELGLVFGVVALLGLASSAQLWGGAFGPFDLRDVIRTARDALIVLVLPVAWVGVWLASAHRGNSVVVGAAPGRPRGVIVARQCVGLAAAVTAGWIAGWAAPISMALMSQHWSWPDVLGLAVLLVAVASLSAVAFAVAVLFGTRLGTVLAPLLLAAVLYVPSFWIDGVLLADGPLSTQALGYIWSEPSPARGHRPFWATELVRVGFFLLTGVAAVLAACGWAEFRATRRWVALRTSLWWLAPVAAYVAFAFVALPTQVPDPKDDVRCDAPSGFTLCLYQIDEPRRVELQSAIDPLVALLPSDERRQVLVTQRWDEPADGAMVVSRLGGSREEWLSNQLKSVVHHLFLPAEDPERRCRAASAEMHQQAVAAEGAILGQVSARAAALAEGDSAVVQELDSIGGETGHFADPAAAALLTSMDDNEFRQWYTANRPQVEDCSITFTGTSP